MRKILSLFLVLVLIFCSLCCLKKQAPTASPADTVEQFSQAMQEMDFDRMASYLKHPGELSELGDLDNPIVQAMLPFFREWAKDMTYTVGTPRIDGNTARLSATYHYTDASEILPGLAKAYAAKAAVNALTGGETEFEKLLPDLMKEQLESAELKKTKVVVTYSLEYNGTDWIISSMPADVIRPLTSDILLLADDVSALAGMLP